MLCTAIIDILFHRFGESEHLHVCVHVDSMLNAKCSLSGDDNAAQFVF